MCDGSCFLLSSSFTFYLYFQDLEELFDKLDADRDGRVSFDEFVDGLSQHGGQADIQPNSRPHSSQGRRQLKFNSSANILDR